MPCFALISVVGKHNLLLHKDHDGAVCAQCVNADFTTAPGRKLDHFCTTNFLVPHIQEPTRIANNTSRCLDQIISNIPNYISEPHVLPPIANCDHCVVSANISFRRKTEPAYKRLIWEYDKANFVHFRDYLSRLNWDNFFLSNDVNICCLSWTEGFLQAAKVCIPNKEITIRPDDLPWYNSSLRCEKRKVMRAYSKAKEGNNGPRSQELWANYNRLRNQYHEHLRIAEEQHNTKLSNSLKNPKKKNKAWWRTVKYFLNRNHRQTIPSL